MSDSREDDVADRKSDAQRERELKFDVPDGWTVPELTRLLHPGGTIAEQAHHLETTYFDTDGRDLLSAGLTLRRRTGDDDTGWQLKVPAGDARTEIRLPLGGRGLPAELRELTTGIRGRAALKPIAVLRTERRALRLLDAEGVPLAELVDDSVLASTQREFAVIRRWREIEVELLDGGDEKLLRKAAALLVKKGASPAASASKLARALDVSTTVSHDPARLSGALARYLDEQYEAMLRGDIELRRGGGAEVIHKTRVATRRYRSVLRVFAAALDAERATQLDRELAWYAAALGEVRDRQVLRTHLDDALEELAPELILGPVGARIHRTLSAEQKRAAADLDAAMRSQRYVALQADLREWRARLPMATDGPAADVERYLDKAERKIGQRLATARVSAVPDAAYHRVRKAAKRARYAAELSEPVLGKRAHRAQKKAKKLQTRLGERQDDVVAAQFLRQLGAAAGTTAGENGFTYGLLYERERTRGESIRGRR